MPARKSNASAVSAGEDGSAPPPAPKDKEARESSGISVEDLALPRTMIQRLAKGVLPPNTQIQKDALMAMSKSATVFVNYLTAHANENAVRANKKTIQPKDVMDAINEIEFEAFAPRLEAELQKYNAIQCDKRNTYRRKIREEKKQQPDPTDQAEGQDGAPTDTPAPAQDNNGDAEPVTKKIRRSSADDGTGEGVDNDHDIDDTIDDTQNQDVEDDEENDEEIEDDDEDEQSDNASDREDDLVEDPIEVGVPQIVEDDSEDEESE